MSSSSEEEIPSLYEDQFETCSPMSSWKRQNFYPRLQKRHLSEPSLQQLSCSGPSLQDGISPMSLKPDADYSPLPLFEEASIIWIQGTGVGSTGSVLLNLAKCGYTREAHKIIELSRSASRLGKNDKLSELWDVMGKRRGKGGITRLMAICITRGLDSPERALALIRNHNADIKEMDDEGRTALHLALGVQQWNLIDPWPESKPLNIDLIRVLIDMDEEALKVKNKWNNLPLHIVCYKNASYDVIKLILDRCPECLKEKGYLGQLPLHMSCEKGNPFEVIKLLIEKWPEGQFVKDDNDNIPSNYLHRSSQAYGALFTHKVNPAAEKRAAEKEAGRQAARAADAAADAAAAGEEEPTEPVETSVPVETAVPDPRAQHSGSHVFQNNGRARYPSPPESDSQPQPEFESVHDLSSEDK